MRFIWQQILGFLLVIVTALAIIATRVENHMANQIQTNRQEQLINYGKNIVGNNFSREDLVRASQLLASENIVIQVYLPNGRIIYPTYDQSYNANLSQYDLEELNQNKVIGFRSVERKVDSNQTETYLSVYLPHNDVGQFPNGFISLGAPLDDLEDQLNSMRQTIYQSFLLAICIGVLVAIFYAYAQTRKIHRLQEATREIARGNYDVSLDTDSKDEFGDLARDFESMSESLKKSHIEIQRQENLRRQFMMDAAHEMRTPLTTMSGLLEGLISHVIPEEKQERSLVLINKETQRLIRLVNENLDYERIRSGQYVLKVTKNNLSDLFTSIKDQMQQKAEEKGDWITIHVSKELTVWADYDRLRQIIINLVTNALQFSEESEIKLIAQSIENGQVEIRVQDEGIGIDATDLESIWERFYKVDVSRKNTKYGESGVGLSVVQSLVEVHGGTITVESKLGEGSTFIIRLPNQPPQEAES